MKVKLLIMGAAAALALGGCATTEEEPEYKDTPPSMRVEKSEIPKDPTPPADADKDKDVEVEEPAVYRLVLPPPPPPPPDGDTPPSMAPQTTPPPE